MARTIVGRTRLLRYRIDAWRLCARIHEPLVQKGDQPGITQLLKCNTQRFPPRKHDHVAAGNKLRLNLPR